MRKILLLLVILAIAFGASWFADHAGEFRLNWLGWQIEGSVAVLLVAVILASALIWLALHWLNSLLHLPSELRKERERLMGQKGLDHLTQAMIAASENDTKKAQKHLTKSRDYLPDSPLPRLLQLQQAGHQKDQTLAHQQFQQLQHYAPTKPLALRGLAEQARGAGKMNEALTHVEALLNEAPNLASTRKLAIDVLSYHQRWQESLKLIKQAFAQNQLSGDEYKRAKATLYMQQATQMQEEKNREGAMAVLKKAVATDPSLQPAVLEYAKQLKQIGKDSAALKTLRNGWKHAPHPEVAAAYRSFYEELAPEKRAKKMKDLAKENPQALESQIILAESAIECEDWEVAKNYLKIGLSKQQTVTLCRLMAELYKKGYGDETEERRWLDKAVTAISDANWRCNHCEAPAKEWMAHCSECHDFATINYLPVRAVAA